MHIRAQNAALIVRRLASADLVQFEVFEVLPLISAVMKTEGKLLCSYPGPAIQVPVDTFMDECFLQELSSFLVQMDVDRLDTTPTISSESEDSESETVLYDIYESVHPRYISELLVGILRGYGQPAVVDRITKRIGDEVLFGAGPSWEKWRDRLRRWLLRRDRPWSDKPWRRSPLWLILRVTLQTSLRISNLYKPFILFFHAHLLRSCVRSDFPSELLYVMRVKMARRLSKLSPAVSHHVYQFAHDAAKETEALLSKRWTSFQAEESIGPISKLERLDIVADSQISLDGSYKYLTKMLRLGSRGFSRKSFIPSHQYRLCDIHDFTELSNGQFSKAYGEDPRIAIADFELSVERNLESWVAASMNDDNAPHVISSCIEQYFGAKSNSGSRNAEDRSIIVLTIMNLWVALDKFVIQLCPLLKEYSPEIPTDFLHGLLLRRSSALKRASQIEEYLCRRHGEATHTTSIFSSGVDDSHFVMKYFRTSEPLQCLHDEIIAHAQRKPVLKRAELVVLNEKSKSLLREAESLTHEWATDIFRRPTHPATCKRCQLENEAETLKMPILEWSLLFSPKHMQLAAFELSPPRGFPAWRDITYMILRDIGLIPGSNMPYQPAFPSSFRDSCVSVSHYPEVFSGSFSGLAGKRQQNSRVTIGSSTMSFPDQTDDIMIGVHAEQSLIFADNGLSFRLYDSRQRFWATDSFSGSNSASFCAHPVIYSGPYIGLHRFVSSTQHTPNDIIASQADCPEEINLHEFIAFSGLRSGPRLQWSNIARELASPSLSFNREEVHTLITQAAWQIGPLSNGVREWHLDLGLSSFGNVLLGGLESVLTKIKANWQEDVTVRTIGASDGSEPTLVSSIPSYYLQPTFGLDNGPGYF